MILEAVDPLRCPGRRGQRGPRRASCCWRTGRSSWAAAGRAPGKPGEGRAEGARAAGRGAQAARPGRGHHPRAPTSPPSACCARRTPPRRPDQRRPRAGPRFRPSPRCPSRCGAWTIRARAPTSPRRTLYARGRARCPAAAASGRWTRSAGREPLAGRPCFPPRSGLAGGGHPTSACAGDQRYVVALRPLLPGETP